MKRIVIYIFCFFISACLFAQTDMKYTDAQMKDVAGKLCKCMLPAIDTIHPRVKELISDVFLFGEDAAKASLDKWMKTASYKDSIRINNSLLFFSDPETRNKLIQECMSNLITEDRSSSGLLNDSSANVAEKFSGFLLNEKRCELLGFLIRISMTDVTSPRGAHDMKLQKRGFKFDKFITINEDSIYIKIYSNGIVDGDSVSVYLDSDAVVENLKLSKKPFEAGLRITEQEGGSTLIFYAENLGSKPPNTSQVEIRHGNKVEKILISCDFKDNAVIMITKK